MEIDSFYRRNLPHYQPLNASYFITFRLAGSLPSKVIDELSINFKLKEKELGKIKDPNERKEKIYLLRKKYFATFDKYLDNLSDGPNLA